jgi:copper chaperone CopZ
MQTVNYNVPAISCQHCVHTIESEVADLQGVLSVGADAATKVVTITFEPPADETQIKGLLAEINYPAAN